MNENEVKTAFDRIEPESGAQERMYANILKKAAAQKAAAPEEKTDAPAAENSRFPPRPPSDTDVEALQRDGRVPCAGGDGHARLFVTVFKSRQRSERTAGHGRLAV